MHKGQLPQPDDREDSSGKHYTGVGFDGWKILWKEPGQKHFTCQKATGFDAAKEIEEDLKKKGLKPYRYRI